MPCQRLHEGGVHQRAVYMTPREELTQIQQALDEKRRIGGRPKNGIAGVKTMRYRLREVYIGLRVHRDDGAITEQEDEHRVHLDVNAVCFAFQGRQGDLLFLRALASGDFGVENIELPEARTKR